jgi:hypothetical protein
MSHLDSRMDIDIKKSLKPTKKDIKSLNLPKKDIEKAPIEHIASLVTKLQNSSVIDTSEPNALIDTAEQAGKLIALSDPVAGAFYSILLAGTKNSLAQQAEKLRVQKELVNNMMVPAKLFISVLHDVDFEWFFECCSEEAYKVERFINTNDVNVFGDSYDLHTTAKDTEEEKETKQFFSKVKENFKQMSIDSQMKNKKFKIESVQEKSDKIIEYGAYICMLLFTSILLLANYYTVYNVYTHYGNVLINYTKENVESANNEELTKNMLPEGYWGWLIRIFLEVKNRYFGDLSQIKVSDFFSNIFTKQWSSTWFNQGTMTFLRGMLGIKYNVEISVENLAKLSGILVSGFWTFKSSILQFLWISTKTSINFLSNPVEFYRFCYTFVSKLYRNKSEFNFRYKIILISHIQKLFLVDGNLFKFSPNKNNHTNTKQKKTPKRNSPKRKTLIKHKSPVRKSTKRKSTKRKSTKRKSLTKKTH